ncbi:MAG: hypothetical protein CM15mP46_1570 [Alphaproteobacteria bacterium]|nr:MAG: hypothetical protein CM15mP46_1570 [Alphaproteobacteria bacterium]
MNGTQKEGKSKSNKHYVKKVEMLWRIKKKKITQVWGVIFGVLGLPMSTSPNHFAIIMDGNRRWAKNTPLGAPFWS